MATESMQTGELPPVSTDDTGGLPRPPRFKRLRLSLKLMAMAAVAYYAIFFAIPGVRKALHELQSVNPWFLVAGVGLELSALYSYTLLTKGALGESAESISDWRLFRIQMSTKALSSIVPGGSAAGSALGYRLMTLSGVPGPDAGFALATAGLGSAVMLNLLFWLSLVISIPVRGVNPGYVTAALLGVVLLVIAGALVYGLTGGKGGAEKVVRWVARRLKLNEDRAAAGVRQIALRMDDLASDRPLLARVAGWAAMNWILDAAALWVFLRAFGPGVDVDAVFIAFGLANVAAVIPIAPGGLGVIDTVLPVTLIGFGMSRAHAGLGVLSYRTAQYFFPIVLGAVLYASLRVGPWSIVRRERLRRLRDLAAESGTETSLDFGARFPRPPRPVARPEQHAEAMVNDAAAGFPAEGDGNDDVSRFSG